MELSIYHLLSTLQKIVLDFVIVGGRTWQDQQWYSLTPDLAAIVD